MALRTKLCVAVGASCVLGPEFGASPSVVDGSGASMVDTGWSRGARASRHENPDIKSQRHHQIIKVEVAPCRDEWAGFIFL